MATKEYFPNVAEELAVWSDKLHALSRKIDHIPSIDKYKRLPQIEELHIIMTELDDRLCQIIEADPDFLSTNKEEVRYSNKSLGVHTNTGENEFFDYDFGG